jgi:hypothetical protein
MNSQPFSQSDEADWYERIRRRELIRSSITLAKLAENIQLTEDFASAAPKALSRLIDGTAELLAQKLKTDAPARDLEQINTVLGFITTHLRYVERARVAQTPWSIVQSVERLLKLAAAPKSNFIVRPTWTYNYSIIGEFVSSYRKLLSCWSWFPLAEWKAKVNLNDNEAIYCISFPRIERMNCLLHANWGHEVGHILAARWVSTDFGDAWAVDEPKIKKRIEDNVRKNPPPVEPLFKEMAIQEAVSIQMRDTMETARQGFVELLCDQVGVHILGPSALAAAMEFAARFSMDVSPLQASNYPPWRYRLRKMLQHCDPDLNDNSGIGYPNSEIKAFVQWLRTGQRLSAASRDIQVLQSNIVTNEAYQFIDTHWDKAAEKVKSMLPPELSQPYRLHNHHELIAELVRRLRLGIPPNEVSHLSQQPSSFQDILTAAWAYKMDQIEKNPAWGDPDDHDLLFRLVLKGCECSYVHSEWGERIIDKEP